jgi:uncharacterized protein (DUF1684 family)
MKTQWLSVVLVGASVATAFAADAPKPAYNPAKKSDAAYAREIARWKAERAAELRTEWLPLAGLFWLKEGESTFGSASDNTIVLPKGPAHAGVLAMKEGGKVGVKLAPGVVATVAGKRVHITPMLPQPPGPPTVLELGTLRMHVIVRGNRVGLRLRDLDNAAVRAFKGVLRFPLDTQWRVTADWVASSGKKISVMNVLNDAMDYESPGVARFTVPGGSAELRAVVEGDKLFFIFADGTSGKTTYGAGRYLYADMPKQGKVILDFNQAFTPPCGFTPYATCPLPPAENRLKLPIEAGERYEKH